MGSRDVLLQADLPLPLVARGKVRDVFAVDEQHLLFVATDRISAFDVVMADGIPGKGRILTAISRFWFGILGDVCPNHLVTADIDAMPAAVRAHRDLRGGLLVPIHWGTFRLAPHPWGEPAERLVEAASAAAVDVAVPKPGGRAEPGGSGAPEPWWRL